MSMDKAIEHNKEHRKPYYGSKAVDVSCRCHGGCGWCLDNRLYKYKKNIEKMLDEMAEMGYNVDRKRGK